MRFSVIIPCYLSERTLEACLASLAAQTLQDFEAILVDSTPAPEGTLPPAAAIAARFPFARYHHHAARLGAHAARNYGTARASGRLLAFLDPDMSADPRWLESLSEGFAAGHTVLGGGVDCPPGYWPVAVHITKYGWWLAGGPPRRMGQLPSGNLALARALLGMAGGFPDRYWEGDTALCYRLRVMGHRLEFWPEARVVHYDAPAAARFLQERFARGFDTGLARRARYRWGLAHRLLRAAASPVTWLVMILRGAFYAGRSGWLLRWCRAAPVSAAGLLAWVCGESLAFLAPGRES